MIENTNAIAGAMKKYADAGESFPVHARGRPERHPEEAARRALRRQKFGRWLRDLRKGQDIRIQKAAELSGLGSARKLAQYETTCYPSGEVIRKIAPVYGVSDRHMARELLRHSDPELFESLTGEPGYEPTELEIRSYREQLAKKRN